MALNTTDITSLRNSVPRSKVVTPESDDYLASLRRWAENAEKLASVVVFVTSTDDVSTTLLFAQKHSLEVAVCCGGHATGGGSSTEGGIVIDLSKMNHVVVDEETMIAAAQGGCLWEHVDQEAERYGLATVGGTVNHTGIGGLTLGGGYGWLSGRHGLVIDNLKAVEIVLADGTVKRASQTENADLFWAVRGAGQSFGVVTEFIYQLHPQGKVWGGSLMFQPKDTEKVLGFLDRITKSGGDSAMHVIIAAPPPLGGKATLIASVFHNGALEAARQIFAPLLDLHPLLDTTGMIPYSTMNTLINIHTTHGERKVTKGTSYLNPVNPEFMREIMADFEALLKEIPDANHSIVVFEGMDTSKIRAVPFKATACPSRGQHLNVLIGLRWKEEKDDARCRDWTRGMAAKFAVEKGKMQKAGYGDADSVGEYWNYDGLGINAEDVLGQHYQPLVNLKTKYDPKNIFTKGLGIKPQPQSMASVEPFLHKTEQNLRAVRAS